MALEKYLTRKAAKEHSVKNHGILRILMETFATEKKLTKHFNVEIKQIEEFRSNIKADLPGDLKEKKSHAERWVQFIKSRISVLKFWSTLCAAFITIYGLGSAIFSFMGTTLKVGAPPEIMISFFLVSIILLSIKYVVDKRVFWYEYMVANLEAIIKF